MFIEIKFKPQGIKYLYLGVLFIYTI